MQLQFNLFEKKMMEMKIGRLNVIYGHSNSGKSFLLNQLSDGFSQKNKSTFLIDGHELTRNEYDCIYIDATMNIGEQLKVGSKSFLRPILMDIINDGVEVNEKNNIKFTAFWDDYFKQINHDIETLFEHMNTSVLHDRLSMSIKLETIEDIITNIINYHFNENRLTCSSSSGQEFLYQILFHYIWHKNRKVVVLIDDFDSKMDEESTINLIKEIKNLLNNEVYFILTTNKPQSLPYILNSSNVFCIKNEKVFDLTLIESFIKLSLSHECNATFEEFILSNQMFTSYQEIEEIKQDIIKHSQYELARMLVNKTYEIANEKSGKVSIFPSSKKELTLLQYIDSYLND